MTDLVEAKSAVAWEYEGVWMDGCTVGNNGNGKDDVWLQWTALLDAHWITIIQSPCKDI